MRDEFLNDTLFITLAQARIALEEWRRDYSAEWPPHGALGNLTLLAYAARYATVPQQAGGAALNRGLHAAACCITGPHRSNVERTLLPTR